MGEDLLIHFGGAIKALDDKGRVGGYLVRFGSASAKDTSGEYFTKDTYLGPRDGDGQEALFHHSQPVMKGLEHLADRRFAPISTKRDDIGIWAETVLDMADEYERKVYELCKSGRLGWSSGSAPHRVKKAADGHITSWPICEGSLTPEPAEPRNKGGILPLKSLREIVMGQPVQVEAPTSTKFHEELVAEIKSLKSGQASLIAAIKEMCEKLAKSDDAPPADEEATASNTDDQPEEEATASKADEENTEEKNDEEEATASKVDEEAAAEEKAMEDEYKNLPPQQKAWVDRQLSEIGKMQLELDRRREVKANHAKRLRAAAIGRGIRV